MRPWVFVYLGSWLLGCASSAGGPAQTASPATELEPAPPPPAAGAEVIANLGDAWQWVAFPGSKCRDGSPAGFFVSFRAPSNALMIYLEGGGSCYDVATCGSNPANVLGQAPGAGGVFDRGNAQNPVADWNMVYVPYCSGDVHMGDAADVAIPGVSGVQQFAGRRNLELFLTRLVPTFHDVTRVLLTGVSAGGIGALMNYAFVQHAFGATPVTMIDDSGPVVSSRFLPGCLNQLRRKYWGLDRTILAECGADCDSEGDFYMDYLRHVLRGRQTPSGLIESSQDAVIRSFWGIATNNGKNDCMGVLNETPMDAQTFERGLVDAREQLVQVSDRYGTFYPAGTVHGWITGPALYTQPGMIDWVRALVARGQVTQVGP
jgi:hypothetical protein